MKRTLLAALLSTLSLVSWAAEPQWHCEWEDAGSDGGSVAISYQHPLEHYARTIPPLFPSLAGFVERHPGFTARQRFVGIADGKRIYDTFITFGESSFSLKLVLIERAKDSYSPVSAFLTQPSQWPLSRSFLATRDGKSYLVDYHWENARIPGPYLRCWRITSGHPQSVPAEKIIPLDAIPYEPESAS